MVVLIGVELPEGPALLLRVSLVHATEHGGEVLRIVPTGPCEDGERCTAFVERIARASFLQRLVFRYSSLGLVLVRPEIRRGHEGLDLLDALLGIHGWSIASGAFRRRPR